MMSFVSLTTDRGARPLLVRQVHLTKEDPTPTGLLYFLPALPVQLGFSIPRRLLPDTLQTPTPSSETTPPPYLFFFPPFLVKPKEVGNRLRGFHDLY